MTEEFEQPEDYMGGPGSRDRELIIALAAALRPSKSDSSWQRWMLGLCGGLAFAGCIGGVAMYGQLSAIKASQEAQTDSYSRMQNQIDHLTDVVQQLARRP